MILPRTALAEWRTVGIANPLGVGISRVQAYFKAAISTTIGISLLTTYRIQYKIRFALLIEGRVLETIPECGARCGVLRRRLVTAPREVRDTARQALRPGCEELAARVAEEMLQTEARPPAVNRHGGAPRGERPTLLDARRLASAWPAASRAGPNGCRCIRAPVGAPPTPRRWESNLTPRRHRAAGTTRAV